MMYEKNKDGILLKAISESAGGTYNNGLYEFFCDDELP